jgi:hypothetical protein
MRALPSRPIMSSLFWNLAIRCTLIMLSQGSCCWQEMRDACEKTNKAVTRLRVRGFAVPAIIRNGSLRVNTSSFAKMKILQRDTFCFVLETIENNERSSFYGAAM